MRSYPDRPFLGVSCAVWHHDKVLLIQRGRPPKQDFWALPGGLVETGEKCAQAVCREVQEETGLRIADPIFVEMKEIIDPDKNGAVQHHFVLAVFAAISDTDMIIAADDAKAAAWVRQRDMSNFTILPGIEESVAKSLATLEDIR